MKPHFLFGIKTHEILLPLVGWRYGGRSARRPALKGRAAEAAPATEMPVTTGHDKALELRSPQFVYRLDTADGLRGESWENRLTGKTVS